jgi:hypothetical protein
MCQYAKRHERRADIHEHLRRQNVLSEAGLAFVTHGADGRYRADDDVQ